MLDPGAPRGLAGAGPRRHRGAGRARGGPGSRSPPSQVRVEGWGLDEHVVDRGRRRCSPPRSAPRRVVDVTFNAEAAAAAALAARPRPEICADQISAILEAGSIRFTPGSADIVPASAGIIAAIADVLRGCPGAEFEIAGHTDAQGPEAANRQLSEERAAAVVAALEAQDLPLVTLVPRGYGASRPVADNDTPDGRASNRRIEFNLGPVADPDPAAAADAAPAADCIPAVDAILAERTLEFEPGAAELTEASAPTVTAIGAALAGCPARRHRDRRPYRRAGLGVGQPATERAARNGGRRGAAGERRPRHAARARGPRLRRGRADRRQRYRGRAGRRTGASPSARLRPRRRRRRKRRRRPPADGAAVDCVARVGVDPRRELDRVRSRLGDDRRRERAGGRLGPRGAASLPRRRARGRRLHQLRRLGLGQPAAQPAPRRGRARRAARRRPAAGRR